MTSCNISITLARRGIRKRILAGNKMLYHRASASVLASALATLWVDK
jgi:hypothetical protein